MFKWSLTIVALLIIGFLLYLMGLGQSLRRASLSGAKNQLLVAHADYLKLGFVTNYSTTGYRVWLSTNSVHVDGMEYKCFAEVDGGWGFDGGRLAMTTNHVFIWLDPHRVPKIITNGYKPPLFLGRY